jgi:hypothetical protein
MYYILPHIWKDFWRGYETNGAHDCERGGFYQWCAAPADSSHRRCGTSRHSREAPQQRQIVLKNRDGESGFNVDTDAH